MLRFVHPLICARFYAALRRLHGELIYRPTRVSTFVREYGTGSLLLYTLSDYQRHSSI